MKQEKKNVNIRELLAAKLLGLSESTTKSCQNLQRSQHNIAVRKNNSGINMKCANYVIQIKDNKRTDQTHERI